MGEFRMPSLGADMEAGTLVEWKVQPGDSVRKGDIVAVVHTDKADIEVEVFETGVVERLVAEPGVVLPVGSVLAILQSESEAKGGAIAEVPQQAEKVSTKAPASVAEQAGAGAPRVSPLARRIAAELKVDLSTVKGTGPHGAVERADVERAAQARGAPIPAPAAAKPAEEAYRGMRKAIAAAMSRSNREIPHYYLETTIDLTAPLKWLEAVNRERPVNKRLLIVAVMLKAVANGLKEVPELNAYWVEDRNELKEAINIGFAISLRAGGLIVPAILDAANKSVDEVMEAMSDLIQRTRAGRLRSSEITDGTVTVTNLGDRGVEKIFGVIYPPQVALVGFGRIVERPWAESGMLGVRSVVTASLAGDHRATDGRRGAQFLEAVTKWLGQPEKL